MTDRLSGPKPFSKDAIARRRADAAARALAEADARRAAENPPSRSKELGGRDGPEPTRYGDWEKKGMICDF